MKWLNVCGAVLATFSMTAMADAGLLGGLRGGHCGSAKSCGCASTCQPACCKPVIVKPCCPTVHTYQRRCSDIKPPCCDHCCPTSCCAPAAKCCPTNNCCPAPAVCAAPAANNCCPAPAACCPTPCAPACAAPMTCCPTGCGSRGCGLLGGGRGLGFFGKHRGMKGCNTCAAPATCCPNTCAAPANTCAAPVCCADPCEIAQLIYESMTACYAKDRRKAIKKLDSRYDICCNPEILCAFVYALNDADEKVRAEAADAIGDQIRKGNKGCGSCCVCTPEVVAALTCALGDCDKKVRKQAEEALELCGYEVVDGCCDTCCPTTCCPTTCCPTACGAGGAMAPAASPTPAPMPPAEAVPAPVPPEEKPSARRKAGLSTLLGLLD